MHLHNILLCILVAAKAENVFSLVGERDDTRNLIFGGTVVPPGKYPYSVSIQKGGGEHLCGAVLIDSEWIITAADKYCGNHPEFSRVEIGRHDRTNTDGDFEVYNIGENNVIIRHPDFEDYDYYPDNIALIKLSGTSNFEPVQMDSGDKPEISAPGQALTAIGWGSTTDSYGSPSDVLQETVVEVVENSQCDFGWAREDTDLNNLLCAGKDGTGTCGGDNGGEDWGGDWGGPLIKKGTDPSTDPDVLVGMILYTECDFGKTGKRGKYTRISKYYEWIMSIIDFIPPSSNPSVSNIPSDSPSVSNIPSKTESDPPSVSNIPSKTGSDSPSVSNIPSETESNSPSVTHMPSQTKSNSPSVSNIPSKTISPKPTETESNSPSVSNIPSETESDSPSVSNIPSTFSTTSSSSITITGTMSVGSTEGIDLAEFTDAALAAVSKIANSGQQQQKAMLQDNYKTVKILDTVCENDSCTVTFSISMDVDCDGGVCSGEELSTLQSEFEQEMDSVLAESIADGSFATEFVDYAEEQGFEGFDGIGGFDLSLYFSDDEEFVLDYSESYLDGGIDESGLILLSSKYYASSNIDENNFEFTLSEGTDCAGFSPDFILDEYADFHSADEEGRQWIETVKVVDATDVENQEGKSAYFCENLSVTESGESVIGMRVKFTVTADPESGSFTFGADANDFEDVIETVDIYKDAEIDVDRCDEYEALEQGQLLCLEFSVSEDEEEGLEVSDISELTLSFPESPQNVYAAISGDFVLPETLVSKECSDGICTVKILVVEQIFLGFPDDEETAKLEGEGNAIISMNGKVNDSADGSEFKISVNLYRNNCDEVDSPFGGIFSLIARNFNL